MTNPAVQYTVVFSDGAVLDYLADAAEVSGDLMIFYVDNGDGLKPVGGVSAHAVHSFVVSPNEGPVFEDPANAVHDSSGGFPPSSPGNQYIRARTPESESAQDDRKPAVDPFRGGRLKR